MSEKYQFFCVPNTERKEFTYLNMSSSSFIEEKKALLRQGFEVEDDVIYAENPEEAVKKFRSNYVYHLEEYNASTNIFYTLLHAFQWLKGKLTGKS
ncbi:hypothetical protein [Photobacterium sp. TLY01]|uniref:hypothetical protein n=1 Tax=Photobacterium sp. TLY01 TaxID=2907534 RepID=UPI001F3AC9FF|nr:hypothetical protein [Photobacterium sp. TLY01]UIP30568.1 hypothetical protein LN341_17820 [Photobacterium sp. TLY01]